MSRPVLTTPEADAQIREIDGWWRVNRSAAPNLFVDELSAAFDIIGQVPNIGRSYRPSPVAGARRVLLKKTRYHVYYVAGSGEISVLAVWHAKRGVGPQLLSR